MTATTEGDLSMRLAQADDEVLAAAEEWAHRNERKWT